MVLLIICAVLACTLWLSAGPHFIFCELFELTDKGGAEGVRIAYRERPLHLLKELPLFFFCRLPGVLWGKIRKRFSSAVSCCYQVPHYSGMVGGKIPIWLYAGDTVRLSLTFPWKKPLQSEEDECGRVSNFIYCNQTSCPFLEIELETEGMRIADSKQQTHELSVLPVVYSWNLSAAKTGRFLITIKAKLHINPEEEPLCAVFAQNIRVVQIPFLTGRQTRLTAAAFSSLAVLLLGGLIVH